MKWLISIHSTAVDFGTFFDGESLEQEDLTLWLNLGTHHIPRAEDSREYGIESQDCRYVP
jgi:Cu2+-containing amine oxidase